MGGLAANYERRLRLAAARLPNRVLIDVRRNTAPHNKTGEMRDSFDVKGNWNGGLVTVVLTSDVIQTITTNKGARPHPIVPRKPGGVLRFKARSGKVVFAKRVNHPGNAASHWLDNTLATWPRMIRQELDRHPSSSGFPG
jgi:hypothetical protein